MAGWLFNPDSYLDSEIIIFIPIIFVYTLNDDQNSNQHSSHSIFKTRRQGHIITYVGVHVSDLNNSLAVTLFLSLIGFTTMGLPMSYGDDDSGFHKVGVDINEESQDSPNIVQDDDDGDIEDDPNNEIVQDDDDGDIEDDPNNEIVQDDDIDKDGVSNREDNCVDISNPDQTDSDADDMGDICDAMIGDNANQTSPISTDIVANYTRAVCPNTVTLDVKNGEDKEIYVKRGESVCIESADGIWHGKLCDGPYAGDTKVEVDNARLIYTPNDDTRDDFLIIGKCP